MHQQGKRKHQLLALSSAAENPPAAKAAAATARIQPKTEARADAQVPVVKRKGLLDGVRLK